MGIVTRVCWALALAGTLVTFGCHRDEHCTEWTGNSNGMVAWSKCGDDRERKIECNSGPMGKLTCTCFVAGAAGKTFQVDDGTKKLGSSQTATETANEQCGWHLSH